MADVELVIKIPDYLYEDIKNSNTIFREDEISCYEAVQNGTPLKTCGTCGFNYGIMTNTEFNPNDIVCAYWESDGLESNDYCSRWKDKESEE